MVSKESEMSTLDQNNAQLLTRYDVSLEKLIAGGGSSLVCQDEELWRLVEVMLKDGDPRYTHSLGLDPLKVMEESLRATHATVGGARARGGLKGLVKAFEVLEQAALNLYLSPWREEYKVVKMYSGIVTHYIKPVLPMPQILGLFGLLGYQPSYGKNEELEREALGVNFTDRDHLHRLSCAFFLGRCECHLLLSALGRHAGDADWELTVVSERQRGHGVQVSLDNTRKTLEVHHLPKRDLLVISRIDGEQDLDLYTAAEVPGGQTERVTDDEGPRPLALHSSTASAAVKPHSNGVTPPSSLSAPQPGKPVCVTTLNHQLMAPSGFSSSAAAAKQVGRPYEEYMKPQPDSRPHSAAQALGAPLPSDPKLFFSSVQHNGVYHQQGLNCNSLACDFSQKCQTSERAVAASEKSTDASIGDASGQRALSLKEAGRSDPASRAKTAMGAPVLPGNPDLMSQIQPISYHDCCDPAHPDPHYTCLDCSVFHSKSCKGLKYCRELYHKVKVLQTCKCGRSCSRTPLVLCRYCGTEYCSQCWYRNPLACACGQTFDQSSSV